jgi:hypothetical protein
MEHDKARISRLLAEHLRWGSLRCPGSLAGELPPILDKSWAAQGMNPALIDAKLLSYPTVHRGLTICAAGKQATPDVASFALAVRVLSELPKHIEQFDNEKKEWELSTVVFPYQRRDSLWYAEFQSEYGSDLEYAFKSRTGDSFGAFTPWWPEGLYESVPYRIGWLLRDLARFDDPGLVQVFDRAKNEKLFGTELILPLMEILERSVPRADWHYGHLKKRLDAIVRHAN